ncbi:MAG: hypothetical protein GDA39_09675 [Hyphomonadaceae bacterium]|nr:hypothetical protein [Hyphomonadaceae bacterium]MBC6413104.1 hypothetical protein [Hyphomonadaceae bacterium]
MTELATIGTFISVLALFVMLFLHMLRLIRDDINNLSVKVERLDRGALKKSDLDLITSLMEK